MKESIKIVDKKQKISDALLKRALGYTVQEVNEEYNFIDDEPVLSKRKKSVKHYPPDLSAIQYILNNSNQFQELESFTIKELEKERTKILNSLKDKKHEKKENKVKQKPS